MAVYLGDGKRGPRRFCSAVARPTQGLDFGAVDRTAFYWEEELAKAKPEPVFSITDPDWSTKIIATSDVRAGAAAAFTPDADAGVCVAQPSYIRLIPSSEETVRVAPDTTLEEDEVILDPTELRALGIAIDLADEPDLLCEHLGTSAREASEILDKLRKKLID
jgi:hypothetical protein